MAVEFTYESVKGLLGDKDQLTGNEFSVLKFICNTISYDEMNPKGMELLLRALDRRDDFHDYQQMLDELARNAGLFPYIDTENIGTRSLLAYEYNRPYHMNENTVFHRVQSEVYRLLMSGMNVILSAPTSFGKSLLIDAMVASNKYRNIAIVLPTLALVDETRRRLTLTYKEYKVITHSSQTIGEYNIFIMTQERILSFDKLPDIDFFVIDEFYKLGMESDGDRLVSLNHAFYKLLKGGGKFYMLGPFIEGIPKGVEQELQCVFIKTNYSTVVSDQIVVTKSVSGSLEKLISLADSLNEPTLIYCSSPARANELAQSFLDASICAIQPEMKSAYSWISSHYHPDWVFGQALSHGIGIHHGKLPRSLSQYVVRKFNDNLLRFMICTSTLIEGVNTKAKNVIIYDNKIAKRKLDYFTFNNIKGRSGRMFKHFIGRVYLFHEPPVLEQTLVDIPVLTQTENTPTSLLLQLDERDLHGDSKERIEPLETQKHLPIAVMRENAGIDPKDQVDLALDISKNPRAYSQKLAWTGYPTKSQLQFVCEIIWKYFIKSNARRYGVSSSKQLAFKLIRMAMNTSIRSLIQLELANTSFPVTPTQAVENVLEFERHWASYEFPKYIMAVSRIQEYVLKQFKQRTGDYSYYAKQSECAFRNRVISAMEEYGVPAELSSKIMDVYDEQEDIDVAIKNFKDNMILSDDYSEFEYDILRDTQMSL
jgi:hypothetical protein